MIYKYSIINMMNEYNNNKHIIDAYLNKKPIEGLNEDLNGNVEGIGMIMGLTVGFFIAFFILTIILFVWAVNVTVKYWSKLSDVAKVILVISWFMAPPILPLIVVYIAKGNN
jgi:hypothetical protein